MDHNHNHNHTNLSSTSDADSDDDRESLVPQPDSSKPQSAFQILTTTTSSHLTNLNLRRHRHLLLCILLPVSILLLAFLFFSFDFGRLFHAIPSLNLPTPTTSLTSDRLRESELRALSLLRTQRLSLIRLLNQSYNSSISTLTNDFKSALFEQVRINGDIQKALLSSHAFGNYNYTEDGTGIDNVGPDSTCLRADRPSANRRTVDWNPKEDRFLFAICVSGQMSNHLICLEKHMLFAALLGRILVLPSSKIDYQYDRVLDVGHVNDCLHKKVVVSFEEFVEMRKKKKVEIDRFVCYMAEPPCFLDEEHIKKLKGLGVSVGKIEAAWPEDAKLKEQKKRTVADVMPKFSTEDEVLAIGDMFYADFEGDWLTQSGGPIAHECKALIQPSKVIMLTAKRFVQTFLGSNFIALHFRRHGFLKFW